MHLPTPLLVILALAARYVTSIPIEPLSLEDLDIEQNDIFDPEELDSNFGIEERDSGFSVKACEKVKTYNITQQNGPFPAESRLAGAQQCVANAAGVCPDSFLYIVTDC